MRTRGSVSIRDCLAAGNILVLDYELGLLPLADRESTCNCVTIAKVGEQVLVAIPLKRCGAGIDWKRRKLHPSTFRRVYNVQVPAALTAYHSKRDSSCTAMDWVSRWCAGGRLRPRRCCWTPRAWRHAVGECRDPTNLDCEAHAQGQGPLKGGCRGPGPC